MGRKNNQLLHLFLYLTEEELIVSLKDDMNAMKILFCNEQKQGGSVYQYSVFPLFSLMSGAYN